MNPIQEALMEVKNDLSRQLKELLAKGRNPDRYDLGWISCLESTIKVLNNKMIEAQ